MNLNLRLLICKTKIKVVTSTHGKIKRLCGERVQWRTWGHADRWARREVGTVTTVWGQTLWDGSYAVTALIGLYWKCNYITMHTLVHLCKFTQHVWEKKQLQNVWEFWGFGVFRKRNDYKGKNLLWGLFLFFTLFTAYLRTEQEDSITESNSKSFQRAKPEGLFILIYSCSPAFPSLPQPHCLFSV